MSHDRELEQACAEYRDLQQQMIALEVVNGDWARHKLMLLRLHRRLVAAHAKVHALRAALTMPEDPGVNNLHEHIQNCEWHVSAANNSLETIKNSIHWYPKEEVDRYAVEVAICKGKLAIAKGHLARYYRVHAERSALKGNPHA